VLRCLLDLVEQEFEPKTFRAFRRLTLDGATGAEVAAELGLSVGAVYVAKTRVMRRIREEAAGLIDEGGMRDEG
jgi:RNA polymerase sigma-70 factor (ECF subfamily)